MPLSDDRLLEDLPRPVFSHPRRISVELHDHIRHLIIATRLMPGQVLKQAQLARVFGVSRTPMREAFRMLQEEGLIDADPNQRPRVRHLDVDEVDQLYSTRILLESFGARLTAGHLVDADIAIALEHLGCMDHARLAGDMDAWSAAHRAFHHVCMLSANVSMVRVTDGYAERTDRYLRIHQLWHPQSFDIAHDDHAGILESLVAGDADEAGARMARHIARTGRGVLRDISPGLDGVAITEALALASGVVHGPPTAAR